LRHTINVGAHPANGKERMRFASASNEGYKPKKIASAEMRTANGPRRVLCFPYVEARNLPL